MDVEIDPLKISWDTHKLTKKHHICKIKEAFGKSLFCLHTLKGF